MDYSGKKGYGILCTVQRSRLPNEVDTKYFHKEQTKPGDHKARVARFEQPITSVKVTPEDDDSKAYEKVHISFQSTSSCNIQCVNSLNENALFTVQKSRGQGERKRTWVIEMNAARQLYLGTYGRVDTIDFLIKKCHLFIYLVNTSMLQSYMSMH